MRRLAGGPGEPWGALGSPGARCAPLRGQGRGGKGARDAPSLPTHILTQTWGKALTAPAKGRMLKHEAKNVFVAVCTYQLGIIGRQLETALTTTVLAPFISSCYCC